VGVCGISVNDVEYCDGRLLSLVCCWWEYVGLVVKVWSFVMTGLSETGLLLVGVCGVSGNHVEFCDDRLEKGWSDVGGSVWD